MIRPTVSLIGRQQVEQAMKDLAKRMEREQRVLVGVPKGAGEYEDGVNYATIMAVNNFGSADGHIPARPVLQPAVEEGAPVYRRLAEVMLPKVLSGEMEMRVLLEQMGSLTICEANKREPIKSILRRAKLGWTRVSPINNLTGLYQAGMEERSQVTLYLYGESIAEDRINRIYRVGFEVQTEQSGAIAQGEVNALSG